MPEVTGLDVLERVRTFSQVPIIVFSAKQDVIEIARKTGVDDSVSKPLNPDYLVEKIEEVLSKRDQKES